MEPQRTKTICPRKLMAPFDDKRDDLDAYLHRFERIALGQGWERSEWATALSLCLVGEALNVFGRMPASESMDYDKVKKALLQRFRLTAEGFREKFRNSKPEQSETGKQFACRLTNYFDRWMEMANTEKTYEGVRERIVIEQFLTCCSPKLNVFLKERSLKRLDDFAESADQFLEAQGLRNLGKNEEETRKRDDDVTQVRQGAVPKVLRCFLCNRVGHRAVDCRVGGNRPQAHIICQHCKRRGHHTEDCRLQNREKAAGVVSLNGGKAASSQESTKDTQDTSKTMLPDNQDAFEKKRISLGLPVVDGEINGIRVSVLRDSGTNTALVRRSLIGEQQLTGKTAAVIMVDSTLHGNAFGPIWEKAGQRAD
ncbi:uncharacterized protein LOC125943451 [Dermacentor silvarum]|uniref:uncharacterized protein LOC125943451 n=1 Tax=Dermacentor silvarum TaxID=543639 RepID=UPI0021012560|nr:uncharacterized protein LOC125943451 [Dermacentor silvarum]